MSARRHDDGCACQRCLGFREGNTVAVRSGFWASPILRPNDRAEVEELANGIFELLPFKRAEFGPAVEHRWKITHVNADALFARAVPVEDSGGKFESDAAQVTRLRSGQATHRGHTS